MSKQYTPAESFSNLRRLKVGDALRRAKSEEAWKPLGGLKYAISFWIGEQGVAWFINKNGHDPVALQAEFDARDEHSYLSQDELQPFLQRLQALEEQYIRELNKVAGEVQAMLLKIGSEDVLDN